MYDVHCTLYTFERERKREKKKKKTRAKTITKPAPITGAFNQPLHGNHQSFRTFIWSVQNTRFYLVFTYKYSHIVKSNSLRIRWLISSFRPILLFSTIF